MNNVVTKEDVDKIERAYQAHLDQLKGILLSQSTQEEWQEVIYWFLLFDTPNIGTHFNLPGEYVRISLIDFKAELLYSSTPYFKVDSKYFTSEYYKDLFQRKAESTRNETYLEGKYEVKIRAVKKRLEKFKISYDLEELENWFCEPIRKTLSAT